MDIFLLPSHFEGLPIVLIEAQAAGLRCIASMSISLEAKITPNLVFVPNDSIPNWVKCIVEAEQGYTRTNNDNLIAMAGYDLRKQIKVIEKLYADEDISMDYPSAALDI
ncbi:putative glycosyltransferase EpsF [compost metagenome]